jgi:hypothetical protein
MKSLALLPASLILISSMACSPRANEAFLADIKKSEAPKETPIVLVLARKRLDAEGWNSAQHAKLNELVELLASRLGFRIEVSHAKAGPSANIYSFTDFMPPTLQGLTFKRENLGDGFTVEVRPDYAREVVLDEVIDAQSGIKKHVQGPNASTFAENVERIRKDNQYKRAWIVSYHFKQSSSLPQDSPFWDLCTKLLDEKQLWGKVAIPNAEIALTANFWKSRGQGTTLASLASYRIVAFEAQDGKLAKTEGWKAFGVE